MGNFYRHLATFSCHTDASHFESNDLVYSFVPITYQMKHTGAYCKLCYRTMRHLEWRLLSHLASRHWMKHFAWRLWPLATSRWRLRRSRRWRRTRPSTSLRTENLRRRFDSQKSLDPDWKWTNLKLLLNLFCNNHSIVNAMAMTYQCHGNDLPMPW